MTTSQIYHWHSELMRQYATGDLIALGATPDEARATLRANLDDWIKEHRNYEWSQAFGPFHGGDDWPVRNETDKVVLFDAIFSQKAEIVLVRTRQSGRAGYIYIDWENEPFIQASANNEAIDAIVKMTMELDRL